MELIKFSTLNMAILVGVLTYLLPSLGLGQANQSVSVDAPLKLNGKAGRITCVSNGALVVADILRNEAKTAKVATQNSKIEDYQKKYPDVSLMSGTLDQYRVSYRLVDGDKAGLELDLTEYNLNNSFNKVVYELSYSRGSSDGNKSEILAAFEIDPFSLCRGYPESLPARAQLTSSVSKYFVPKIASKVGDVVMWKASAYVSRCSRHVQDCEEKVGPSEISKALQSHSAK